MQELQRQAAEQVGGGLWSLLNPFTSIWKFLLVVVAGVVGYTALSKDDGNGGGFLSKLFNLLPDGAQEWLAGTTTGIDGKDVMEMRKIAQSEGSDGLSTKDYLKPNILFRGMTEKPQTMLNIARTLPKGGEPTEESRMALAAMRQIINDPKKLATLLSDTHKANTYALLETMAPMPLKPGALGAFIDATAWRDGKIDPAFVRLLNAALSEGTLTERLKPEQVSTFFARPGNADAFGKLLGAVDDAKLTPQMREAVKALRAYWGNLQDGLAEVMADRASLQYLLKLSTKPKTLTDKAVEMIPDSIKTFIGQTMPSHMTKLPEKAGENAGHLLALQAAFQEAGITLDGAAAPAPKGNGGSGKAAHH